MLPSHGQRVERLGVLGAYVAFGAYGVLDADAKWCVSWRVVRLSVAAVAVPALLRSWRWLTIRFHFGWNSPLEVQQQCCCLCLMAVTLVAAVALPNRQVFLRLALLQRCLPLQAWWPHSFLLAHRRPPPRIRSRCAAPCWHVLAVAAAHVPGSVDVGLWRLLPLLRQEQMLMARHSCRQSRYGSMNHDFRWRTRLGACFRFVLALWFRHYGRLGSQDSAVVAPAAAPVCDGAAPRAAAPAPRFPGLAVGVHQAALDPLHPWFFAASSSPCGKGQGAGAPRLCLPSIGKRAASARKQGSEIHCAPADP